MLLLHAAAACFVGRCCCCVRRCSAAAGFGAFIFAGFAEFVSRGQTTLGFRRAEFFTILAMEKKGLLVFDLLLLAFLLLLLVLFLVFECLEVAVFV